MCRSTLLSSQQVPAGAAAARAPPCLLPTQRHPPPQPFFPPHSSQFPSPMAAPSPPPQLHHNLTPLTRLVLTPHRQHNCTSQARIRYTTAPSAPPLLSSSHPRCALHIPPHSPSGVHSTHHPTALPPIPHMLLPRRPTPRSLGPPPLTAGTLQRPQLYSLLSCSQPCRRPRPQSLGFPSLTVSTMQNPHLCSLSRPPRHPPPPSASITALWPQHQPCGPHLAILHTP